MGREAAYEYDMSEYLKTRKVLPDSSNRLVRLRRSISHRGGSVNCLESHPADYVSPCCVSSTTWSTTARKSPVRR